MPTQTAERIKQRLISDFHFKQRGDWLQQGLCPECNKREMFTRAESPWVIRCGRESKCAEELRSRELYPDLYQNLSKKYQPTKQNPNATADAYLHQIRGFDLAKIKGWYSQGSFYDAKSGKGTSTVRFNLTDVSSGEAKASPVYWERFIENADKIGRNMHFGGKYSGMFWHQGDEFTDGDTVYLVEGILDAISLNLNGFKAVALLTCNQYPKKLLEFYQDKNINWVWALDSDMAGKRFTRKFAKVMRKAKIKFKCAQIPQGVKKIDWNDLHQSDKLSTGNMAGYLYLGSLLVAENIADKAMLIYKHQPSLKTFHFNFYNQIFWFTLDVKKYDKATTQLEQQGELSEDDICDKALIESKIIREIANCYPQFLYFQRNEHTDESWYYARINQPGVKKPVNATFTAAQLGGAADFDKRLLSVAAGAMFDGDTPQLKRIRKTELANLKTVLTIDYIGYNKVHLAYLFNKVAVVNGQIYNLNQEDYFDLPKVAIKTLAKSPHLNINTDIKSYNSVWFKDLVTAFLKQGVVVLAFWIGSLFAEQIRQIDKTYPFLEVVGEPGTGKTTLIEFLWKLFGRFDYEGFNPSKITPAALGRSFNQVSNLPVVLMEGDREEDTAKGRKFDFNEIKDLYNGRPARTRGVKNSGNDTDEQNFKGAVVITQNANIVAEEAVLQRIVHLDFKAANTNHATMLAARRLEQTSIESVSGFILKVLAKEKAFLECFKSSRFEFENQLNQNPEIKTPRIAKNHAQIMALLEGLKTTLNFPEKVISQAQALVAELGEKRQKEISADHPMVQAFWDIYDYLDNSGDEPKLNHSKALDTIAINLNHFTQHSSDKRQQVLPLIELKKYLKTSRKFKFLGQKTVSSKIWRGKDDVSKSVKCWVFNNPYYRG